MLPKLDTPIYETELPISKKTFRFRPFLVKEQKILLMANESEDPDFLSGNLKQIIKNCSFSEDIDIDELSSIDIEYIFIQLRARSIGEVVETTYRCKNKIDNEDCNNLMDVKINLLDINLNNSSFNSDIKLAPNIGIVMKYPNFKTIESLTNDDKSTIDKTFDAIYHCIDYIYDENNFYYSKELSKKDVIDFVESFNTDQFNKIEEFFTNLPKLEKDIEIICSKCGYSHTIHLEGLNNFLE